MREAHLQCVVAYLPVVITIPVVVKWKDQKDEQKSEKYGYNEWDPGLVAAESFHKVCSRGDRVLRKYLRLFGGSALCWEFCKGMNQSYWEGLKGSSKALIVLYCPLW